MKCYFYGFMRLSGAGNSSMIQLSISPDVSRGRYELLKHVMNSKGLNQTLEEIPGNSLYLNESRKNLAANLERSPLTHSYCYGSADDRPTLFVRGVPKQRVPAPHPYGAAQERVQNRSRRFCARLSRSFVPFIKYPA